MNANPSSQLLHVNVLLRSLTTETTSQLDVLGLNGDTLGMDGAKVGILEKRDEVCFNGLLKSTDGG